MVGKMSSLTSGVLNRIIGQRAGQQYETAQHGRDLRQKLLHVLIFGNQEELKKSFSRGGILSIFGSGNPVMNLGISSRPFKIIGLTKRKHAISVPYNAWDCGSKYVVGGLNTFNEPVILDRVQDSSVLLFPIPTVPSLNLLECRQIP